MGGGGLATFSLVSAAAAAPTCACAWTWTRIRRHGRAGGAEPGDVIVIFGAAAGPHGPSPELDARLRHAVDLYRRGRARTILCSGGHPGPDSEPRVMRRALVAAGVPEHAVLIEETGSSTRRTLAAVERLSGGRWRRILVVSSPYHMYRIVSEARRMGMPVAAAPAPATPITRRLRPRLRQSLREVAAVWWYVLTAPSRRAARSAAALRADLSLALEPAEAAGAEPGHERPEMACAVISLANESGLVDAVRSVLRQHPRPEIVVVNSGGGDSASTLHAAGIDVPVIDVPERLLAGAVRNLGIEATSAPHVSFLAADCIAEPGWVDARLRAHRAGAAAVTSALTVAPPQTLSACASHLLLHHRRRPEVPPGDRVLAGLSYRRDVLDAHGRFREDMAVGEDTEYVERLDPHEVVAWSTDVRTAHRYPPRVTALLRDQFARGRRAAESARRLDGPRSAARIMARNQRNILFAIERAHAVAHPEERRLLLAATPLLVLGALACTTGVLSALVTPRTPGGAR